MSRYVAETEWTRASTEDDFLRGRYSRRHLLRFDGGVEIAGSASAHNVPLPWSDAAAVDPEEAFIAALSSCHLLTFVWLASRAGFCVDRYVDAADGVCEKDAAGKLSMTVVTLRPRVAFSAAQVPSRAEVEQLHHRAHDECFIANSVRTDVRCEPVWSEDIR